MTTADLTRADPAVRHSRVGTPSRVLVTFVGVAALTTLVATASTAAATGVAVVPTLSTALAAAVGFGVGSAFL